LGRIERKEKKKKQILYLVSSFLIKSFSSSTGTLQITRVCV
jgi:hypothetical protein